MAKQGKTAGAPKRGESSIDSSGSIVSAMEAIRLIPKWCRSDSLRILDSMLVKQVAFGTKFHLFELVALWVGADPLHLRLRHSIPEWIERLRLEPISPDNAVARVYAQSFEIALRAVRAGELEVAGLYAPDECDIVAVAVFETWAKTVNLPRVIPADNSEANPYGTPMMEVARKVWRRHYASYDPKNPPHPDDVKKSIRDLGVTVKAQIEMIYKMVRDPDIPVGRRRKSEKK